MTSAETPERPSRLALSKDLSDFLIEFSIALNKHAMYPGGHPSLGPACERVIARLDPLFATRGTLSLGVARQQLVIEGVATDPTNPVLHDLAGRLHRHHLGAVTFRRGLGAPELREALSLIAVEADRREQPLGLGPPDTLSQWPSIQFYALTYDRLALVEDDGDGEGSGEKGREQRTRAAQLWLGLARAAVAAEGADEAEPPNTEPTVVAEAIQQHARTSAYDQVIVGYMLQIAEEVRTPGERESTDLRKRISRLVEALDPATLGGLLEMGGDRGQRRRFLLNAAEGMAVDAVIHLVEAASVTETGQGISHAMLRMLQKLGHHAERGRGRRRVEADSAVRDQIAELVRDWSLADPNPGAYGRALSRMAESASVFTVAPEARHAAEPRRIIEMALEVDTTGELLTRAVERTLASGELRWLVERLEGAEPGTVRTTLWEQVATPPMVVQVALAQPLDLALLDALLAKVGAAAGGPLLDVLATSESSQTRRALLDRIPRLGDSMGPLCLARLDDERWYVQRNLLRILGALSGVPAGFQGERFLRHPDPRVRIEAIRILLEHADTRARALGAAVGDPDERIARLGLTSALSGCPAGIVPLIVHRASSAAGELRTLAVRVLGVSRHPAALTVLLDLARPRKGLFRYKLPAKSPEYLAALRALAQFPDDPGARAAREAAQRSRDPEIATAAREA